MKAPDPRSSALDERLTRELKRVRTPSLQADPRELDRLQKIAFAKARRRFFLRGSSALVVAGLVFVAVSFPRFIPSVGPGSVGPVVAAPLTAIRHEPLGFWPAVDEDDARAACTAKDLRGAEDVARRFAVEVLGWGQAAVSRPTHDGGPASLDDVDRTTFLVYYVPRPYGWMQALDLSTVTPPLPRAVITVEVSRIDSGDCWWVTGLDPEGPGEMSASLARGTLTLVQDPPEDAARADLITLDGTSSQPNRITTSAGTARARFREFQGPGYVIVIWKGKDGWAMTAAGQTVRLQPLKAW